jgi:hypothetical protein
MESNFKVLFPRISIDSIVVCAIPDPLQHIFSMGQHFWLLFNRNKAKIISNLATLLPLKMRVPF